MESPTSSIVQESSHEKSVNKRLDVQASVQFLSDSYFSSQGLRGVSIIAVVLFHINSNFCSRGFLGVDVFFVISGYLIWTILSRDKNPTIDSFVQFYSRRFARIVPLYSVTILITLLFSILSFASLDLEKVIDSTKWAAFFVRNVHQVWEASDYWIQAAEFSPLLHTWSLSVEVQFYLAAPFLHTFISSVGSTKLRLILTLALASASFVHYGFSNGTSRFYTLPSRLWQFLVGFIAAQFVSKNDENECASDAENGHFIRPTKSLSCCSLETASIILILGIWILLIFPFIISPDFARFSITLSASILLFMGTVHQSILLSNRFLCFVGDISYELYLVHWPLVVFYQYASRNHDTTSGFAVYIGPVLAQAQQIIEGFSNKQKLYFVVVVYSMIAFLCVSGPRLNELALNRNLEAEEAPGNCAMNNIGVCKEQRITDTSEEIQSALHWAITTDIYPFPPYVPDIEARLWTNYTNPKHTAYSFLFKDSGNLSILLLGNSFAWRAASVIHDAFEGKFKTIRLFSELGCPILIWQPNCTNFRAAFLTVLERMKPDIVWVIAWEPNFFLYPKLALERQVSTTIRILQNHSEYVVIDGQSDYHGFTVDPKQEMIRRLQLGYTNFTDMQLSREEHDKLHESEWTLMRSLVSPTITFNNVADQFCEPDYCPFYNPLNLHQYYGDRSGHLNQEGLDRLRPGYKEVAKRITDKLEKT